MTFDIRSALSAALAQRGMGDALAWQGRWLDWAWLDDRRHGLDALLVATHRQGVAVGLVARNRPGCVATLIGQVASGRTTVMIHAAQSPVGIAADIARSGVSVVIGEEADWTGPPLAAAEEAGMSVIACGDADRPPHVVRRGATATIAPRDPATGVELLSSGTTGPPKRVPLTWATMSSAAADARGAYAGTGARAAPQILLHPLGTIAGASYLLPAFAHRQPMVLLDRFTVAGWVAAVRAYRPLRASLPPVGLAMLLDADVPPDALASLEVMAVGGGRLDPAVQDRFEARFGVPVLTAFGATEFAGVIANWNLDLYRRLGREKRGSAGRASANVDLRIVDPDTLAPLPPGAVGLLEARVARLGAAWVRTTDLAALDADGFLFVHGRADGAINRGGFKIVPDTVVAALLAHPDVADAAVVARTDDRLGEVPVAAVEARPGGTVTAAGLHAFLVDRLLAYQLPAEIRILDRLPRNGSMKVALGEVAALFRYDGHGRNRAESPAT